MTLARDRLTGPPYTYHIALLTALDQPCFAGEGEQRVLRELLETIRLVFDCRIFAWAIAANRLHLVLRHSSQSLDREDLVRQRWALLGGSSRMPLERLRRRLTSLGGLMQCLAQRSSQGYHQRHGTRGHLWAGRYRACLLADDAALLVATVCCERLDGALSASSRTRDAIIDAPPHLAPLPLRTLPGGLLVPADEAQLGLPHPLPDETGVLLKDFVSGIARALPDYRQALAHGWALGRPESLTESLGRLGRASGRGRSRQIRELDDELGLCGVWG